MSERMLPVNMAAASEGLAGAVDRLDSAGLLGAISISSRRGQRIEVDDQSEAVIQTEPRDGTVVTAFDGRILHERAMPGFDPPSALRQVEALANSVRPFKDAETLRTEPATGEFETPMQLDPQAMSTQEKLERVRDVHRRVHRFGSRVVNVRAVFISDNELTCFRSATSDLTQRVQRLVLFLFVVTGTEDGKRSYDWAVKYGTFGWEGLEFSDDEIASLVADAEALLTAERLEPGEYSVITSPAVAGVLCHESFGHGVETDMFLKGRARAADYLGRQVASPLVNIVDDPGVPGAYGSYYFDDEGWPASPTRIVEDGVFRRGITDFYSATMLDLERSGNGRRQDYSRKVYARMSNTFFEPRDTPVAELFNQVERGIYLEKASSGIEDPLGWGIQITCHKAWEIVHGNVSKRLFSPVGVTGYVPDLLKSISAVGDERKLIGGTCGKGHKEYLRVADGGPHLLLKARLG